MLNHSPLNGPMHTPLLAATLLPHSQLHRHQHTFRATGTAAGARDGKLWNCTRRWPSVRPRGGGGSSWCSRRNLYHTVKTQRGQSSRPVPPVSDLGLSPKTNRGNKQNDGFFFSRPVCGVRRCEVESCDMCTATITHLFFVTPPGPYIFYFSMFSLLCCTDFLCCCFITPFFSGLSRLQ